MIHGHGHEYCSVGNSILGVVDAAYRIEKIVLPTGQGFVTEGAVRPQQKRGDDQMRCEKKTQLLVRMCAQLAHVMYTYYIYVRHCQTIYYTIVMTVIYFRWVIIIMFGLFLGQGTVVSTSRPGSSTWSDLSFNMGFRTLRKRLRCWKCIKTCCYALCFQRSGSCKCNKDSRIEEK